MDFSKFSCQSLEPDFANFVSCCSGDVRMVERNCNTDKQETYVG